jgi:hypothetical protein
VFWRPQMEICESSYDSMFIGIEGFICFLSANSCPTRSMKKSKQINADQPPKEQNKFSKK